MVRNMLKRVLLAGLSILAAWTITDVVLHRVLLEPLYEANSALWRPIRDLSIPLIYTATISLIGSFIAIYQILVAPKSLRSGILFGALMGLVLGVSVGLGTYIHMPIPVALAWGWFLGAIIKALLAGAIVGLVLNEPGEGSSSAHQ